jgi:predicted negative regulator of RcsB-dependent stress response
MTVKRIVTIFAVVLLLAVIGWQQYQIHQINLEVEKAQREAEFATGANKITQAMVNTMNELLQAALHAR